MAGERLERIINEMLKQRPNLTREELLQSIAEKKKKVGSGYLTDIGASYLVANDFGIDLDNLGLNDYSLKELNPGMTAVNVKAYFLAASKQRSFKRKDGSEGLLRSVLLFDDNITMRLVLWDAIAQNNPFSSTAPCEPIRVTGVSTRMGRDNQPEIHSTAQTRVELLDPQLHPPKSLDVVTMRPPNIITPKRGLIVKGVVSDDPRVITFQRQDNTQGKALQFTLSDPIDLQSSLRVVLWSYRDEYETIIKQGTELRLINIDSKTTQAQRSLELHGNDDTAVEIIGIRENSKTRFDEDPFTIISVGSIFESLGKRRRTLLLGRDKRAFSLTVVDEGIELLDNLNIGDRILLQNYSVKDTNLFVQTPSERDIQLIGNFPSDLSYFRFKVNEAQKASSPGIVELVVLAKPITKEITLKNGRTATLSEVLVGDETGETKLVAWRDRTKELTGLLPGARLIVYGAVPRMDNKGNPFMEIRDFTSLYHVQS
jgi:ssDNA-binding replication factor A large subunit